LLRGADFVAAGLRSPDLRGADYAVHLSSARYRPKLIGNALRELDRFLNLLADEASRILALPVLEHQHNTANKLRDIAVLRLCVDDHSRLQALGRMRERLYHCGGQLTSLRQLDIWTLAAGRAAGIDRRAPRRRVLDGSYFVTDDDLIDIATFYRGLAMKLRRVTSHAVLDQAGNDLTADPSYFLRRRAISAA